MSHLCWIRRDLRLHDHAALSGSLEKETTVVFVFDKHILEKLTDPADRRITFIYQSLQELEARLQKRGSSLIIRYGNPEEEIPKLAKELKVTKVFWNRDYEPYAKRRDKEVTKRLQAQGIASETFKDTVFFEAQEVTKNDGGIYKVFTPYKNKWLEVLGKQENQVPEYKCDEKKLKRFNNPKNILAHDWYQVIGFTPVTNLLSGGTKEALKRLKDFQHHLGDYQTARNFPALPGTSYLSAYIRHGCISVRDMLRAGLEDSSTGSKVWVSEIIWRDFYQMILGTHPYVEKGAFKPEYDKIKYPGTPALFKAWCRGQTGYPVVDAAMRCLNETGMMHNRLRMITASFLCKILLVDWKKGEQYFKEKLLDFDLAANNGGWQWSSSSGCDAQPYFRIFNPYTQSEKFDSKGEFIKTWIPELNNVNSKEIHKPDPAKIKNYPPPIVNYTLNRIRCLEMYAVIKKS
ncbi:MAG TPA: deoxyribodipyrimidine photo-lyase [Bacteriovoracaceae bacterium]|nr:deoxyribodipyrimidine photo-lyase [Bacteriovoracaceae bacterium]